MNKEELIKEYDEKAKALRDEFISKLEDDKKEFKLTYPENCETVYFVNTANWLVGETYFYIGSTVDKHMFETGSFFKTYEEAEQYLKERKLLFKLHQWAEMKNDGWEPDWEDYSKGNYYMYYTNKEKKLCIGNMLWTNEFTKLPYFKTREIAQECIDIFGDEIKEVLV
jgi:hypothetical protein